MRLSGSNMNALRSVVFNFFYIFGSFACSIALSWALLLPHRKCAAIVGPAYGGYMAFIEKHILGLRLEIKGMEHLPKDGPYIIAAKHQSAFETLHIPFTKQFRFPVIIHKKELLYLPVWGLYLWRMGEIGIDRGQGMQAMNKMVQGCRQALADGRSIIIFPQGTRVAPGVTKPYKAGLAKLYKELNVPVVPLALNTGVFWGRNQFFKKSGTVTYRFLPPIPPGLPPLQVMETIEKTLEAESDRLVKMAGGPALSA